ncbi:MAG: NAD(P)H-hydrate dehydratase, partial [Burkholderiales bacterium]|nr:NAD(P)H-hydrate dehydratase [Burkholderiales bacterium]
VRRLVLDADAINAIAAAATLQALLRRRADAGLATLLTPHPLEAARLLGASAAEVQRDRLGAATGIAAAFGAAVLLKGSGSIVAAPGRLPVINPSGNAALATAGTGDVLAGWAAGLWAQAPLASADEIGTAAAWIHGDAADRWVAAGHAGALRAGSLIAAMAGLGAQLDAATAAARTVA